MLVSVAVDKFLVDRGRRGCLPATIKHYHSQLKLLTNYLNAIGIVEIGKVRRRHLEDYVEEMRHRNLMRREGLVSPVTVRKRVLGLRTFFQWCRKVHLSRGDPSKGLAIPRAGRRLPKTLLPFQLDRFLSAPANVRDRAIVLLLLDTGMRLSEAAALNVDDLDLEAGLAHVRHGKGDKERWVVFVPETAQVLRAWMVERAPPGSAHGGTCGYAKLALFVGPEGKRLTAGGIYKVIKRLARRVGLEKVVRPHVLRHTFATFYLNSGGKLYVLQQLLGHESIATTMQYVDVSLEQARLEHSRYSPVRLRQRA